MAADGARPELSEFLKRARARLSPAEAGLPHRPRRRSAGLSRDEVALLAGVSLSWYTWFEQGRQVGLSTRVLESIARALRLSPEEREYLFALAQHRAPPLGPPRPVAPDPAVLRMLHGLLAPALILTPRWDVVAWNRLFTVTFGDYGALPPQQRNVLRVLFTEAEFLADPAELEHTAARVVAKFRIDYSQAADRAAFDALVAELEGLSEVFSRHWRGQAITTRSVGPHRVNHARLGWISVEYTSYMVEGVPELRLLLFAPQDAASAVKLKTLADEVFRAGLAELDPGEAAAPSDWPTRTGGC